VLSPLREKYYGSEHLSHNLFIIAVDKYVKFAASLIKFSVFITYISSVTPSDLTVGKGFD
jgi:hypothetical protein